jgi:dTDP-4-dehydrorhamnose 3,5-epimerase
MSVQVEPTSIPDVMVISPRKLADPRGFFAEVYRDDVFRRFGFKLNFVQENHSLSSRAGTIRGLHFQTPPFAQDKLVRVIHGRIFDVAVDIRQRSPTFGQHVAVELSSDSLQQIFIPAGFAHGFCTLEPDTEVLYRVTNYYAPENDRGLLWNDPELGIKWPLARGGPTELSDRDRRHPPLRTMPGYFE